ATLQNGRRPNGRRYWAQFWNLHLTPRELGNRATWVKGASRRRLDGRGHIAGQHNALPLQIGINYGHRRDECLSIGMPGCLNNGRCLSHLTGGSIPYMPARPGQAMLSYNWSIYDRYNSPT